MSAYAITGVARDGTGYPCRVTRRKAKGYVATRVNVEGVSFEGCAMEKDLKYVSEDIYKKAIKRQNRIGGGKKSYAKRKTPLKNQAPRTSGVGDKKDSVSQ